MAETPRLQCRGLAFDPWLVNEDPSRLAVQPKKKEERARPFTRILSINPTSVFVNFKIVSNYSSQVKIIYQTGQAVNFYWLKIISTQVCIRL